MTQTLRIKRFSTLDRLFHVALMITFLIQSATGFGRLFINSRVSLCRWDMLISYMSYEKLYL